MAYKDIPMCIIELYSFGSMHNISRDIFSWFSSLNLHLLSFAAFLSLNLSYLLQLTTSRFDGHKKEQIFFQKITATKFKTVFKGKKM